MKIVRLFYPHDRRARINVGVVCMDECEYFLASFPFLTLCCSLCWFFFWAMYFRWTPNFYQGLSSWHLFVVIPWWKFPESRTMRNEPEMSGQYSFFYKNQLMSAEARMFLILIHIFSNSHPTPTLNTCLKCFTWPKLSFGKFFILKFYQISITNVLAHIAVVRMI